MKTKLSLTFLLSFIFGLLSSQVPQGFNYQAIARLTTGEPIINTTLPVRITIQADSLGTAIIWQELHNSVTTNGFGLITLILGKGARQAASTVATFNAIDWTVSPKFIKTEINYSGWKTMGVTRLWSVPYAKIAENLGGAVSKLAVTGKTSVNDEALFEVKNKNGQTVFAVYNEGVRVYVSNGSKGLKGGFAVGGFGIDKAESTKYLFVDKDSVRVYLDTNPLTKKLKGGFAVGGYDLTKGIVVQDYLDVNSDSVRIYIDSNPATKKVKGGFAVGGYDMVKGTNTNYMNVNTDASGIINPSQNRILWYPLKNAFLTGRVRIGTPDSVGVNSFATGYESKSRGMYSQAMGYKAIANGDYSTAIGKNAIANNINSFAFGEGANSNNSESYAIGRGAVASGYRSFAFGSAGVDTAGNATDVSRAIGDYSFAIGQGSRSIGKGSFSIGIADTATGNFSVSIGYLNMAKGLISTSIGGYSQASGVMSTAIGYFNKALGYGSIATGKENTAKGEYSTAMGWLTTAEGQGSTSMGIYTFSKGQGSLAGGYHSNANGLCAISFGSNNNAIADGSMVLGGYGATATGMYSTAIGIEVTAQARSSFVIGRYNVIEGSQYSWINSEPLFVIGNGTSTSSPSNAFTVYKNGNTYIQGSLGIGTTAPDQRFVVYNGSTTGRYTTSGWTHSSDIRLKENVLPITNVLSEVLKLQGVRFNFINDNTKTRQIGFIAQDFEKIFPEFVVSDNDGYKSISYGQISAVLVEAIKEQQKQIESYKSENDNLKSQLQTVQEKVDKIEALLAKTFDE